MPKIVTHTEFVNELKEIQPELLVIGEYKGCLKNILVKDKEGIEYLAQPANLLYGHKPTIRIAVDKTSVFVNRINKFGMELKVLSKYKGRFKEIIVEDNLGIKYSTIPDRLLVGNPPNIVSAIDKNLAFAIKAREIHGNKYDYSESEYVNDDTKIKIRCPKHGYFYQRPSAHLSQKQGCTKCYNIRSRNENKGGGWQKSRWIEHCMNDPKAKPQLYIIHFYNEKEQFIKIGITKNALNRRYYKCRAPYSFNLIGSIYGEPEFIYNKEIELRKKYSDFKYKPTMKFCGATECFSELIMEPILKEVA